LLTSDECVGMSGSTEDEIAVIAEHQHLPLIVAAGLAQTLLTSPKGKYVLRSYICDLLAQAKMSGQRDEVNRATRSDSTGVEHGFLQRRPRPAMI